ncbi:MAG TPA: hypothetical protein VIX63_12580 [Vicinamibacterales bacterium]
MRRLLFLLALLWFAAPAGAAERYAIVVSGVSGGEKYAQQQEKWRADLTGALKTTLAFPEANVVVFSEQSPDSLKSTAENLRRVFGDLRQRVTSDDTLLVVLLGHGTFDGSDAKFNLVGPDLTAVEWKALLADVAGRLILVNTTASSFPFLEELSLKGRVVITATDSAAQRFATVFPEYFVKAMSDVSSDFDKNGRMSIWEVFTAASGGVKQYYEQRGQLSTERPLLDDDGDRVGREALAPGMDGALARSLHLDAVPGTVSADVAIAALERQRAALEAQLEDLKGRRSSMSEADYQAELEKILVQLARVAQQIRQRS